MTDKSNSLLIRVFVGPSSSGHPVFEELLAMSLDESIYRLLSSPGLALGLARDDIIKLDEESGIYSVVSHGGNLCIQMYSDKAMSSCGDELIKLVVNELGGSLDGRTAKQLIFSVEYLKGFSNIERIFNSFASSNPGSEWFYGNVYDEADGVTPLNWWMNEGRGLAKQRSDKT